MNADETRIKELEPAGSHPDKLLHRDVTEAVIGVAFAVHSELGYGFLEKVYQQALQVELIRANRRAELEVPIAVRYGGVIVGEYFADLLVDGVVVVEIKVAADYRPADEAQLLNQLKATSMRVGLLINFGRSKVQFRRMVL